MLIDVPRDALPATISGVLQQDLFLVLERAASLAH